MKIWSLIAAVVVIAAVVAYWMFSKLLAVALPLGFVGLVIVVLILLKVKKLV